MSKGYVPFPTFSDWAAQANGFHAFDRFATTFTNFSAEQRERYRIRSTRSAAVDTNAIEGVFTSDRGFTYSIATMAEGWEQRAEEKGAHVRPSFEAAMEGYNLALDAATQRQPLTEAFIRALHTIIMNSQDEYEVYTVVGPQRQSLPKGEYKRQPNFPTLPSGKVHYYASPEDTPREMRRLVEECTSEAFGAAHPVIQASYIHFAFVSIHPFADGNGRVSRALASIYLYRNPGIPLVVFDEQKLEYYRALELADDGSYRPFINFIEQCAIDTMNTAMVELESSDDLADLLSNLPDPTSDPLAQRLADAAYTELEQQLVPVVASGKLKVSHWRGGAVRSQAAGYTLATTGSETITFVVKGLDDTIHAAAQVGIFAGSDDPGAPEYKVMVDFDIPASSTSVRDLDVYRRELEPALSLGLTQRLRTWTKNLVHTAVSVAIRAE